MADNQAPIIIKRIKKVAGGHHGGAWKVAYADFVTAMMAFFLLLWLLSVTTPDKRKAIADYFTPTIGIKESKGLGPNGGKNISTRIGRLNTTLTAPGIVIGQVPQGPVRKQPEPEVVKNPVENVADEAAEKKTEDKKDSSDNQNQDSALFTATKSEIQQALEEDEVMKNFKNNIQVEQTLEGLKINLIDDPKKPMFIAGGAALTEDGKKAIDSMANIINKTPNHIAIVGHTDAALPTSNPRYTTWELSADRANAARRALVATQIGEARVVKVVGLADRELLVKDEPNNPRNRRVTIILLRGSYARDPNQVRPTGRGFLSVDDAKLKGPEKEAPAETPPTAAQPPKSSIFDQ